MSSAATADETLDKLLDPAASRDRRLLLQGGTVLSMDPGVGDFARADILIEGTTIRAVAPDLGEAVADGQGIAVDLTGAIAIRASRTPTGTAGRTSSGA